jgi:hypothetical protein
MPCGANGPDCAADFAQGTPQPHDDTIGQLVAPAVLIMLAS